MQTTFQLASPPCCMDRPHHILSVDLFALVHQTGFTQVLSLFCLQEQLRCWLPTHWI